MDLINWEYDVKDLSKYPNKIFDNKLSVLANAVYAANYDLALLLRENTSLLEVGCGIESYVRNNRQDIDWHGIDVFQKDCNGNPTIATKIASVNNLPYKNNLFDYVLSNQSIEHWYEYEVDIHDALGEICRVLKVGGFAYINFPIHLHGKKEFVLGDFEKINQYFDTNAFQIVEKKAYIDSKQSNYPGWRYCSIPDFYINSNRNSEGTAYIVEYVLKKKSDKYDKSHNGSESSNPVIFQQKSLYQRTLQYGWRVLIWRAYNKILKKLGFRGKMPIIGDLKK
jgi:SAM-dependent methyltransferase